MGTRRVSKVSKTVLILGIAISLLLCFTFFNRRQNTTIQLSKSIPEIDKKREAKVLTAFFGLDNDLPWTSIGISWKAPNKDGMPLVFSQEIDPNTLDLLDFLIISSNGTKYIPDVATLAPANEQFELRTVLLIGNYGDYPNNEPMQLEITGELLSRSGQNYKGQKVGVTALEKGPFLSYSEYFKIDDDYPYTSEGQGCDCPKDKTKLVVRTV